MKSFKKKNRESIFQNKLRESEDLNRELDLEFRRKLSL